MKANSTSIVILALLGLLSASDIQAAPANATAALAINGAPVNATASLATPVAEGALLGTEEDVHRHKSVKVKHSKQKGHGKKAARKSKHQ